MQKVFTEEKSEKFLKSYLSVASHAIVHTEKEAVKAAKALHFPVVMKILSPDALHKSDIGGVGIVQSPLEVTNMFQHLMNIVVTKNLRLTGILLQEHIRGTEFVIGIQRDPTFGHVLMVGVGGVFVELLADVSFRVCPITSHDAQSMLNDLAAHNILKGLRGNSPVNQKKLIQTMIAVSKLPKKYPEISELDINPLIVNDKQAVVVDARISFQKARQQQ